MQFFVNNNCNLVGGGGGEGSVPDFLREPIATCDIPWVGVCVCGGVGSPVPTSGSSHAYSLWK